MEITLTSQNFETEVLQSEKPVLVGFLGNLVRPVYAAGAYCRRGSQLRDIQ